MSTVNKTDWEKIKNSILMPNSLPLKELSVWLSLRILRNIKYVPVVIDSGYDVSTSGTKSSDRLDVSSYISVGQFLENEYTGETVPTHCSGSGLAAQTYDEAAYDEAISIIHDHINNNYPELFELDDYYSELIDFECDGVELIREFRSISLKKCIEDSKEEVERIILDEALEKKAAQDQEDYITRSAGKYTTVIENYHQGKITKQELPEFLIFLDSLVSEASKHVVACALRRCRLDISNSVRETVFSRYVPNTKPTSLKLV